MVSGSQHDYQLSPENTNTARKSHPLFSKLFDSFDPRKFEIANRGGLSNYPLPMSSTQQQADEDWALVQRFLNGDENALGLLYNKYHPLLLSILPSRGARPEDAEEVDSWVWARCMANGEAHSSLLEKFSGKSAFKAWITAVATNRWYDIARRRSRFEGELPHSRDDDEDPIEKYPDEKLPPSESALTKLLHECLTAAFDQCEPESLIMLYLVWRHDLSQRRVGELWKCSEATISRRLSNAMDDIRATTLNLLKQKDPRLKLKWEDFEELCQVFQFD